MKKTILCAALVLSVSACFSTGATFQRWVGTYEYDGIAYRVALVEVETFDGSYRPEYHLVPGAPTDYDGNGAISRCPASDPNVYTQFVDIRTCERAFARDIDSLAGPPMMDGGDY